MRDSEVQFIVNRWPLIERRMRRADCEQYLREHNLPVPPPSSCVICPFKSVERWRMTAPLNFEAACRFDEETRHNQLDGMDGGELFISNTLKPLRELDLRPRRSFVIHQENLL